MADFGHLYAGFSEDFPSQFRRLVKYADVIVPNVTEACLIADYPYSENIGPEDYPKIAQRIIDLGAKNVVLTGVYQDIKKKDQEIGYYIYTKDSDAYFHIHKKEDTWFKGVGDVTVSLITAYYLLRLSVKEAVIRSAHYVEEAIQHSLTVQRDQKLGIYFEPIIPRFSNEIAELRQKTK